MFDWLGGLFRKALFLVLLLLAAYAGWLWGPEVFPRIHDWLGLAGGSESQEVATSPAIADSALAEIQRFRRGEGSDQLALDASELTSLVRFSIPELMPEGVVNPAVTLKEGRIHFRSRVALASFPDLPDLGPFLGILPDTVDVALEATMMPFGEGRAALLVHKVEAMRIPLPGRVVPEILQAMGREERPGLPPEAIMVPLPSGLGSAYISTDSLVLSRDS
ncbi:MAG: hypothetical protein PVJ76_00400 [Gemmatimonadota bacterium]|jgi:hypothetical protein